MHYMTKPTFLLLFFTVFLFASCDKLCDCDDDPKPCLFSYGKVAFTQTPGAEQIVNPAFTQGDAEGSFSASPAGLVLDENTGAIDINSSETDQEYTITYTLEDGETACITSIYINAADVQECALKYDKDIIAPGEVDFLLARIDGNQVKDGKFYAIPSGLVISPSNGSIDVNASESGTRYIIYYESADGRVKCQTELTISGIDFIDTRVAFVAGQAAIVTPIYNAVPGEPAPQGTYRSEDVTLAIDNGTGAIDLKQTLINVDLADNQEVDFSILNFRDNIGFTRTYLIDYIVNDIPSQLEIELFWFPNEENIPEDLLEVFEGKQSFPRNGKILERPPYMLCSGDHNK